MAAKIALISIERIEGRILLIRGHRVLIDADLAGLYGVPTKALNQAHRRNSERFPDDFAFRLTAKEMTEVVTNCDHLSRLRFSPVRPLAFTEHGAIMAANVLNSPQAVRASVMVVRAFVRLRQMLATHHELAGKLAELEERIGTHDKAIQGIMRVIRDLMEAPPDPPKERIGFHSDPKQLSSAKVMQ
ncbi:MAG TPA: ORF6N domain-containing protein [Planctomycetota bacterium]|nr:ORF6N domain-containing protein [Planctomycetota bacterium]